MKQHLPRKEDIRSEAFMRELFGLSNDALHKLAKEHNFNVAVISNKVRLYDISDAQKLFLK